MPESDAIIITTPAGTPPAVIVHPPGLVGPKGEPGAAATVTVGTVTTAAPGTPAAVTNTGTSTDAVLDFVIPRGEEGVGGGITPYATEALLLAAPVPAAGATAWAQDTATWFTSDGTSWQAVGVGALSETALSIRVARYEDGRSPAENAAYLNGLLAGGNVKVILQGRREWLTDRSVIMENDSELNLNGSTLKFSQIPVTQLEASNPNAVVSSRNYGYVPTSGAAVGRNMVLRNGTLDAGGFGTPGSSSRYNGYSFTGIAGGLVENVTCQNGTGYLQWLPACSYWTVRNTTSINGEENVELAEHAHHILLDGVRSKDSFMNGFLFYQGVHDVVMMNCTAEGVGNGIGIAPTYGDCYNITVDGSCSVRVGGVPLLVGGVPAATYATLPAGFTRDAATGTVRNQHGAVVYVADQNIRVNGNYRSDAVTAVQTGSDGAPPRGLILEGRYRGKTYGMTLIGAGVSVRNAEITVDVDPAGGPFPAVISTTAPLDLSNVRVQYVGETNYSRRRYLVASTGSRLRGVVGVGDPGYIELHRNALVQDCEVNELVGYYEGNRVTRGSYAAVGLAGTDNLVTDAYVSTTLNVSGANSLVAFVQMGAGGTFNATHATAVELANYVGGSRRVDKNVGSATGGGDMLKGTYDPDGDGKVTSAVNADAAPWAGISGKPSTFPSTIAGVTGLQAALDAKAAAADLTAHTGNTSNPHAVTKAQVGLGNVTNDAQVKRTEMGAASGVATLGPDGKVPATQLPANTGTDPEVVRDTVAAFLVAGSNVTLTHNDAADTLTISGAPLPASTIVTATSDPETLHQELTPGTFAIVNFTTVVQGSGFDLGTDTWTCPTSGEYLIAAGVQMRFMANAEYYVFIFVDGIRTRDLIHGYAASVDVYAGSAATAVLPLTQGSTVTIRAYCSTGVSYVVGSAFRTFASFTRLR